MVRFAQGILNDPSHILFSVFDQLPLGRCYRGLKCKTNHLRLSFIPVSISLINSSFRNSNVILCVSLPFAVCVCVCITGVESDVQESGHQLPAITIILLSYKYLVPPSTDCRLCSFSLLHRQPFFEIDHSLFLPASKLCFFVPAVPQPDSCLMISGIQPPPRTLLFTTWLWILPQIGPPPAPSSDTVPSFNLTFASFKKDCLPMLSYLSLCVLIWGSLTSP